MTDNWSWYFISIPGCWWHTWGRRVQPAINVQQDPGDGQKVTVGSFIMSSFLSSRHHHLYNSTNSYTLHSTSSVLVLWRVFLVPTNLFRDNWWIKIIYTTAFILESYINTLCIMYYHYTLIIYVNISTCQLTNRAVIEIYFAKVFSKFLVRSII